jgi:hypothetical protein
MMVPNASEREAEGVRCGATCGPPMEGVKEGVRARSAPERRGRRVPLGCARAPVVRDGCERPRVRWADGGHGLWSAVVQRSWTLKGRVERVVLARKSRVRREVGVRALRARIRVGAGKRRARDVVDGDGGVRAARRCGVGVARGVRP